MVTQLCWSTSFGSAGRCSTVPFIRHVDRETHFVATSSESPKLSSESWSRYSRVTHCRFEVYFDGELVRHLSY